MESKDGDKMVKHIILWNLKDEYSKEEREEIKRKIKVELEALVGQIQGLVEMKVQTSYLDSSSAELMLDSTFESVEALKGYAIHPKHVAVADNFVRPFVSVRSCLDFEI